MGLCLTLKNDETIYLWTGESKNVDDLVALSLNSASKENGYDLVIHRENREPYNLKTDAGSCKDSLLFMHDDIVSKIQMKSVSNNKLKLILDAEKGVHILHKKEKYNGSFIPPEWKCTPVKMAE